MNSTVVAVVSGVVTDMIEVSTHNGQVLESGVAISLLQVRMFWMIHHTPQAHDDPPLKRTCSFQTRL